MKLFLAISLCILTAACHIEKTSADIDQDNRRYHVVCVDSNGKEYYNKVGIDAYSNGGSIIVLVSSDPYVRDIVTGNCVASQFDIRDKRNKF